MMNAAKQRQVSWDRGAELLPLYLTTGHIQKLFGELQHTVRKWYALGELATPKVPPNCMIRQ